MTSIFHLIAPTRAISALAVAFILSACASNPQKATTSEAPQPTPVEIHKVALIRALDPASLTAENRGSALSLLGFVGNQIQRNIERNRGNDLETLFDIRDFRPGKELSEAVLSELRTRGFDVEYLVSVPRQEDDVTEIDFAAIDSSADAFIQIQIDEMGLYSGMTSTKFHPRFNVDIEMLVDRGEEEVFAQSIEYGVDASELSDESIPADAKYAYGSFGDAFEHGDELIVAFRQGIALIARSIARQIDEMQMIKKNQLSGSDIVGQVEAISTDSPQTLTRERHVSN